MADPLTQETEKTVRCGGVAYCSETTFATIFATLDRERAETQRLRTIIDIGTVDIEDEARAEIVRLEAENERFKAENERFKAVAAHTIRLAQDIENKWPTIKAESERLRATTERLAVLLRKCHDFYGTIHLDLDYHHESRRLLAEIDAATKETPANG